MALICRACGADNPAGKKFCGDCGTALENRCPQCGAENPAGKKFCGECGAEIRVLGVRVLDVREGAQAPTPNSVTPNTLTTSPRSYTPKHLAEKILQSKSALEGERKQVTVLFADVKGSMELAEQLDPEEWHTILDRFFAILTEGVHRFEGTVNQYTGDGIMALFGAPIAHEDHAQRACWTALHLRDELRDYADALRVQQGVSFSARMGLNSGEVVVGRIGDDLRMDYTAQGHVVGLAARMEQLAEPRSIYLTEHTAKLVSGYFHLRDLGRSRVKGVSEALQLYELEGLGALRSRLEVSRARGFSKFVGRADEVATLDAALTRALAGHGQVVGVVADAGVGKSRLCFEFLERCRARNLTVLEGRAVAHGQSIAFLPMLQVFRAYFGITEQDTDRSAREKIAGRLLLIDESFREVLPLLFEFFVVPDPERPAPDMDPEARQRHLFGVLGRLVQQGTAQQPVVTLLEDLHWIDPASEAFLAQWVDAIAPANGLLLLNFRPEYRADWMRKSYYQQLPLLPLRPEALDELFRDLLGGDASLAAFTGRIRERTAGNPFFIEEVVQSLAETGALVGSRGAYRLARPADTFAIPATVQALLAARIDRLPESEKHVLQTAAAIGREFSEPLLRRVLSAVGAHADGPPELAAILRALTAAEFVYEQALYPVAEYAFKHPLTQEVAHDSQLAERRQRTHAAVARALGQGDAPNLDELAALIAHHWGAAGEPLIAARWHQRAAVWAANRDLAAAHRHWDAVRQLVATLPETDETCTLRLSASVQLVNLGWRLATSRDETDAVFAEGQQLALRAGDLRAQAMLCSNYSLIVLNDDVPKALECYLDANRLADRTGDLTLRVAVGCMLRPVEWAGELRQALQRAEEVIVLTGTDPFLAFDVMHFSPYVWLRVFRGAVLVVLGRPRDGLRDLEDAVGLADRLPLGVTRTLVHSFYATACCEAGDAGPALLHAHLAIETAERSGSHLFRAMAYGALGAALVVNAEWDEARRAIEDASAISRHVRLTMGPMLHPLVDAYLGLGDAVRARATADEVVAIGRQLKSPLFECRGQIALARIVLRTAGADGREEAEAALTRAAALAAQMDARLFDPEILTLRGTLAESCGDADGSVRARREAQRLWTEMGLAARAAMPAPECA